MSDSQTPDIPEARRLYWSVRRELWQTRSVFVAPLAAAGVVMLGFLIGTIHLRDKMRAVSAFPPAHQTDELITLYGVAALPILFTAIIVSMVYCIGALHAERRDRSILFWKSLPVSDLTAVLAKASIPLVIVPFVTFTIIAATQLTILLVSMAVLLTDGGGAGLLWAQVPVFQMPAAAFYSVFAIALWFAPLYGWLLLVSSWAARVPFLWAVSPLALCVVEFFAFGTNWIGTLLKYRITGVANAAYIDGGHGYIFGTRLFQLDPGKFLTTPGLWEGIAFAAMCVAGAVWLRRHREPI